MIWRVFFALQGLVLAHELGHFLVARLVRMPVEVVSLGMGPRLFGIRTRETDYRVSLLPVGGYVRVCARDTREAAGLGSLWQELVVLAAGPVASLLVPLLLFLVAHARQTDLPGPEVGDVEPAFPADGVLAPGDLVQRVDSEPIETYWDLERVLAQPRKGIRSVDVLRDGKELTLRLQSSGGKVGVLPVMPRPIIAVLGPESPAYRAGLRSSDEIVAIGGRRVSRWSDIVTALVRSRGDAVQIAYFRPTLIFGDPQLPVYEAKVAVLTSRVSAQPLNQNDVYLPKELAARTGIVRGDLLVARVVEGRAAWDAGLRAGDLLRRLCGEDVGTPAGVRARMGAFEPGCELVVWRQDAELHLRLGEALKFDGTDAALAETRVQSARFHHVPGAAYVWGRAWRDATHSSVSAIHAVRAFLSTGASPLGAGTVFRRVEDSLHELGGGDAQGGELRLYANLSAQLGVVNLLPLPMLDGGTLLWSVWARLAPGSRYASPRAKRIWDFAGWVLLGGALLWFLLRDFGAAV